MILVDTSVWVDHLRSGNQMLASLLEQDQVLTHPFVLGELACGAIRNRDEILLHLQALPSAQRVEDEEALSFVEQRRLFGRGIGWIDAHLLASAVITHARLMTLDRRLARVAAIVGVSH
jgi:predicted nucleic acid-binding protein